MLPRQTKRTAVRDDEASFACIVGGGLQYESSDGVGAKHVLARPTCRLATPLARKPVTFFAIRSIVCRSAWFRQDLGLRETQWTSFDSQT